MPELTNETPQDFAKRMTERIAELEANRDELARCLHGIANANVTLSDWMRREGHNWRPTRMRADDCEATVKRIAPHVIAEGCSL